MDKFEKQLRVYSTGIMTLLFCHVLNAQLTITPSVVNYGILTKETDRVVDIIIQNNSSTKDFLLRSDFSHEFEVRYTSKTLEPNGNIVIRIKFNPREKGPFEERVELFFASMQTPIVLPIRADVQYVNINEDNPCPDFSQQAADCCSQNMFLVEVIDKTSQLPIEKSTVRIEEDGHAHLHLQTNKNGQVSQEARIGFYNIIAEKQGYRKGNIESYINKRNNHFRIELERDASYKKEEITDIPAVVSTLDEKKDSSDIPGEKLPEHLFRPNNIVFLLDVSSSMATGDKLELLKTSLTELTSVLRPIDQVTLISYAGDARTLLETTTGDHKNEIIEIIREIRANGTTSGAKGFKRSYDTLLRHYLNDANNQLIVITDGAFNPSDQIQIEKLVKRSTKKNIRTSIVAIQSNSFAKDKLSLVSTIGNGSFLLIEDPLSANTTLIEELKKQSAR